MKEATTRTTHDLIRQMVFNAVFAALLCVLSPLAIPIGPVPISLGLFAVLLTGVSLRPRDSAQVILLYLVLGAFGLPVFSRGAGGAQVLIGPTGGYLWSYLLVAPAVGLLHRFSPRPLRTVSSDRNHDEDLPPRRRILLHSAALVWDFLACLIGVALCYTGGTIQYCLISHTPPVAAMAACVWPFIPFDLLKSFLAVVIGRRIRALLNR